MVTILENLLNDKLSNPIFFWLDKMFAENQHVLTNFDPSEKKLHKLTDTNFMWTITA